jgi:hypothetical protein
VTTNRKTIWAMAIRSFMCPLSGTRVFSGSSQSFRVQNSRPVEEGIFSTHASHHDGPVLFEAVDNLHVGGGGGLRKVACRIT